MLSFASLKHFRDKEPEKVESGNEAGVRKAIETIYRREGRRVFASLVRILGEFELAEELEYSHANPAEPSPLVMRRYLRD